MEATIRILLVEDNPGDADLVIEQLSQSQIASFSFVHVTTLQEAKEKLSKHTIDVILLDSNLPDSKGLDTLREIKAQYGSTPTVVVSGLVDEQFQAEALPLEPDEIIS